MPITLTPSGFVFRHWLPLSKEMIIESDVPGFEYLSEYLEIQPRTTLGDIFAVVDRDQRLKELLKFSCYTDFETLHAKPRFSPAPFALNVGRLISGVYDHDVREVQAESFDVGRRVYISRHPRTNDWQFSLDEFIGPRPGDEALAENEMCNFGSFHCGGSQHLPDPEFGALCMLPIRLYDTVSIELHTEEHNLKERPDLAPIQSLSDVEKSPEAQYRWTLGDFIHVIYDCFGKRPTSPYTLADQEDFAREDARIRRLFGLE